MYPVSTNVRAKSRKVVDNVAYYDVLFPCPAAIQRLHTGSGDGKSVVAASVSKLQRVLPIVKAAVPVAAARSSNVVPLLIKLTGDPAT